MKPSWWLRYFIFIVTTLSKNVLHGVFMHTYIVSTNIVLSSEVHAYVQVYNNCIIRFISEPTDSLSLIRDDDQLVAYRLPKDFEDAPLVLFMHQQLVE